MWFWNMELDLSSQGRCSEEWILLLGSPHVFLGLCPKGHYQPWNSFQKQLCAFLLASTLYPATQISDSRFGDHFSAASVHGYKAGEKTQQQGAHGYRSIRKIRGQRLSNLPRVTKLVSEPGLKLVQAWIHSHPSSELPGSTTSHAYRVSHSSHKIKGT